MYVDIYVYMNLNGKVFLILLGLPFINWKLSLDVNEIILIDPRRACVGLLQVDT